MGATERFAGWDDGLRAKLEENTSNASVGTALLLENERARYWELHVPPGGRIGFYRHVLDYVWACVTGGLAVSRYGDGSTVPVTSAPGETRRLSFAAGESMIRDLENTGDAELVFRTIECLDSANPPLPLATTAVW